MCCDDRRPPHVLNALVPVVAIFIITIVSFGGHVDVYCDDRRLIVLLNSLRRPFVAIVMIITSSFADRVDVCCEDRRLIARLNSLRRPFAAILISIATPLAG